MKNKKKKVLHILPSNSFSGAENVVCTIIDNNKLYEMYYCCPRGPIEEILKERNIKYIPLTKKSPKEINKICKENDIDILHAHDYKASFLAGLSGFKGKIISHLHVNWDMNRKWNIYTIAYNFLIKKFSSVIVVSQEIYDTTVFVKKNKSKFKVITNVVDKSRVIKQSEQFITNKYDLIYVGRISAIKRPEMIIEITKQLKKDFPKIKVCIIGKGELEESCKELIKKYKLDQNIEMLGFKKNPFPYIKNSKIALLPSLHEGLPMSVIECMILKVPVINSGVDGMATLFKDNKEFICNNIDEYCTRIKSVLNNKIDLSNKCEDIIKDAVDMESYINKINEVYK